MRAVTGLLVVLTFVLTLVAREQQSLNEQLVENERRTNDSLHAQSVIIAQLQQRLEGREQELIKLRCQLDLIAAASRSSWGDAYRVMKTAFIKGGC